MAILKKLSIIIMAFLLVFFVANATQEQVRVEFNEYVNQSVLYNPLSTASGLWAGANEQTSNYSITGYITVFNNNPNGKTISDIWISLDSTGNMTLPVLYTGRNGTFVSNDTASGLLVLHIPELNPGENSTWVYSVNNSVIRPVLNLTTSYSNPKILAGENLTFTDSIVNEFDNNSNQADTCVYNISLVQSTIPVNFSGVLYNITFAPSTIAGSDAGNVSFSANNQTQTWNLLNTTCLNKGASSDINYTVLFPTNFPSSGNYHVTNTVLKYSLNQTVSHVRLVDITAISKADFGFEKKIIGASNSSSADLNVTWNVTGNFNTTTNISYVLNRVTLWVSQRNVNGSYTDPNTIDNDTVSNTPLNVTYNPLVIVNSTSPWMSAGWNFNYTDIPTPIVWMDTNFTIRNDGVQLINRSVTQNNNEVYVKELYVIVGYWLEINKNITAISNNSYHIRIDVKNKGNFATPADTVVTVYDFLPSNYNITSPLVFSDVAGGWYSTNTANNSVMGQYNGTLIQWGLIPTGNGAVNSSLDGKFGSFNQNNSWSVDYNVSGFGDYNVMDVFITGLDPQQVDGAGSSKSVIVSEIFDRISSTEGIFASVASVLLLLGLLL